MTKNLISNPVFLERVEAEQQGGFNLLPITNSFNSIFGPMPLSLEEKGKIQTLLFENFSLEKNLEQHESAKLDKDLNEILNLTMEIKAIHKQSLVLIGERIQCVRNILKKYREGTFTIWLKETFKSKQTGYNILAYYEFYKALPSSELQELYKDLPQKAAYILASREGNLENKVKILRELSIVDPGNFLPFIRENLPISENDKRKTDVHKNVIDILCKAIETLYSKKGCLSPEVLSKLERARSLIDAILENENAT